MSLAINFGNTGIRFKSKKPYSSNLILGIIPLINPHYKASSAKSFLSARSISAALLLPICWAKVKDEPPSGD